MHQCWWKNRLGILTYPKENCTEQLAVPLLCNTLKWTGQDRTGKDSRLSEMWMLSWRLQFRHGVSLTTQGKIWFISHLINEKVDDGVTISWLIMNKGDKRPALKLKKIKRISLNSLLRGKKSAMIMTVMKKMKIVSNSFAWGRLVRLTCLKQTRQSMFNSFPLTKLLQAQDFLLTLISSEANYQGLF